MNSLKALLVIYALIISAGVAQAEAIDTRVSSELHASLPLKCTGSLFGEYAQCYGKELGAICPYYKNNKLRWGSCKAADSSGDEIYCLCR